MATGISARLSAKELRKFGFTVAIPFALLASLGAWRGQTVLPSVLGGLAVVIGGLALLAPALLGPVQRMWMAVVHALGWFNTRMLLSLVYFLVMTPTGALMRLVGRDPLDRSPKDRASYWVKRGQQPSPRSSMERRF